MKNNDEKIIEYIHKYSKEELNELIKEDVADLETFLAFTEIRKNTYNWYPFELTDTILEINPGYGEITQVFLEKAKRVVCLATEEKQAEAIQKRYKEFSNLEVFKGTIDSIKFEEKFDYIIITGKENELENNIKFAKQYLNEKGKILLAVDNKFGIKFWNNIDEETSITNNSDISVSKAKLDNLLEKYNLTHKKYYYPLPDYKMTNVIYTDSYMPDTENISRDLIYNPKNSIYNEAETYKRIIHDDLGDFVFFANSYIVECSEKEFNDNEIRFISFTNLRKEQYRIKTVIKKEYVYKTALNEKSLEHIANIKHNLDSINKCGLKTIDKYEGDTIISEYQKDTITFDKYLLEVFKNEGKEKVIEEITKFKQFLIDRLKAPKKGVDNIFDKYEIEYDEEILKELHFVKKGLWDLIFQNCFYKNNEYYFYDQEWFDENVPVEFIIYRSILYFNGSRKFIPYSEFVEILDLKKYEELFYALDTKIQNNTRNSKIWGFHTTPKKVDAIRDFENMETEIAKLRKEDAYKNGMIQNLRAELDKATKEIDRLGKENAYMKNSFSWKITKPLRTIRSAKGKLKGK